MIAIFPPPPPPFGVVGVEPRAVAPGASTTCRVIFPATATGAAEASLVIGSNDTDENPFTVFEKFPFELVRAIEREAGVRFIGNYPRSGTVILEELGPEHIYTGNPILYTSADSVLQIAAHEVVPMTQVRPIVVHHVAEEAMKKIEAAFRGRVR